MTDESHMIQTLFLNLRRRGFFFFDIFAVGTGSVERGSTFPKPTVFVGVAILQSQHPHSLIYSFKLFINTN